MKSSKPNKQRKSRFTCQLHARNKFMSCHLSKELRQKHKTRNLAVRKDDKVKVMVGQFKGKSGKVEKVDAGRTKVYVAGIEITKKDGGKALYPLHPSNLLITELYLEDKKRLKRK